MNKEKKVKIKIHRLNNGKDLSLPIRMTEGSSGWDIYAAVEEDVIIEPMDRKLIPTGFCMELPKGIEVQIRSRSGLAVKYGVFVLNSPGTIDSDYRGEVKVILANIGKEPFIVKRGDRIAQLVVAKVVDAEMVEEKNISSTKRGEGGFGHTGV